MNTDETKEIPVQTPKIIKTEESVPLTTPTPEVGWSIDKGVVRANNEDSLATVILNQASESDAQAIGVYAVADGMGGHESGEVASKLAVRTAIHQLVGAVSENNNEAMPENYQQWLTNAVSVANQMVRATAHEEHKNMGTTLVMALVVGNDVHIANVGDSRAYIISPKGIRQITRDQSLVQALVDSGTITPEQAVHHPRRNVLTQALGSDEEVNADLFNETLEADESILLCSDGLWGMLGDQEILQIVQKSDTPSTACQALVDACNAKGARDNIAAVLVRIQSEKS
jgi:serine/threonine protein phosphatase PrpC